MQTGLEYLSSTTKPKVLTGFAHLIKCASLTGGPLAVANAKFIRPPPDPPIKAIPKVLELAKTQDPQYSKLAVRALFLKPVCSTQIVLICTDLLSKDIYI